MCSGISLPDSAAVGTGLHCAHPGMIVMNGSAVAGSDCLICQGVTIGTSSASVPIIGDRVCIGANGVVADNVHVGDGAAVSACSLATRDVPTGALASGVPADNKARPVGPADDGAPGT